MNKKAIPLELRRHKLVAAVRKALWDSDTVVGVSGGADSIALLLLCCAAAMQKTSRFKVVAAHINHGLRPEADVEQKMVEQLCKHIGIECISKRVQVEPVDGSLAAGARKVRYEAIGEIATALDINIVVVAHQAEDQLETMLMALCRGGGLRKLSGIAKVRPLCPNVSLTRPLLHVEKKELIHICELANVQWCEDPTNLDPSTPRGRLRKDVIPVLRELWTSADMHAANASTMLHAAADAFDDMVPESEEGWDRHFLAEHQPSVIDAALQRVIGNYASFTKIQTITSAIEDECTHPRTFQLRGGCSVIVTANEILIHHS